MRFTILFVIAMSCVLVPSGRAGYLSYGGFYGAYPVPYAHYGYPVGRSWSYGSVVKHGYGLGYAKPLLGYGYGYAPYFK